ncbi:hypothetical protein ABEB36_004129 [Hypothenemus hampei]|uniref:Uncharacterized protein n=1 Tax=Hypothenemus hampei TaxID=57062 RepID=A0ABD1F604_HYPHA
MTQREVTLDGGVPWGFRMHGGSDQKLPLRVSRVNPGSKAAQRGIREGDLITSINGIKTKNLSNEEAHDLLKKSSSTLKLGLNEDTEKSQRKKNYHTIHQETHQETVKRSTLSYTLQETIEKSSPAGKTSKEFRKTELFNGEDTKTNGTEVRIETNIPICSHSSSSSASSTLVPEGQKDFSSDHAVASRQSSYSNCSSIPDEGSHRESRLYQEMNDAQERVSKSKKRRQRKKNALLNRSISQDYQSEAETDTENVNSPELVLEPVIEKNLDILKLKRIEHKYKVESPKELKFENTRKLKAKSKSLDDDDFMKIQELSEASESEETKTQTNVIISEASSEENLLDSDSENHSGINTLSLQLNDNNQVEIVSNISPQEEHALRTFLGGLHLVTSPEESAKELYEKTNNKAKRQQKRKELEEYFIPFAENPRYLDAISEEASDLSDREGGVAPKHIKQTSPEVDEPILVEAKVIEPLKESICDVKIVEKEKKEPEIVYLNDSSDDGEDVIKSTNELHNDMKTFENSSEILNNGSNNQETVITVNGTMTPPPTPDLMKNVVKITVKAPVFDYTKTPNILKAKEPEAEKFNKSVTEKNTVENSETRTVSAVHMKKKTVNGRVENEEFRKVKVDEISKNGDVEVIKEFEEEIKKPEDQVYLDCINKESTKTPLVENTEKSFISESESETKKESTLKHVIMTSRDSNKTDSQKLQEFENIKQINKEFKEKTSLQTSIRRPNGVKETVVLRSEGKEDEIPSKIFVQKRVNEFLKEEKTECLETTEKKSNLVKNRIKEFDPKNSTKQQDTNSTKNLEMIIPVTIEETFEKNQKEGGSVLKHLLQNISENKEHKKVVSEKIIPINIESIDKKSENSESKKEHMIPITVETKNKSKVIEKEIQKNLEIDSKTKTERIIPIEVEKQSNNPSNKSVELSKEQLKNINENLQKIAEQNKKSVPQVPPVPPPRKSKTLLLKKRNETLKQTESLNPKNDIPVSNDMAYSNIVTPPRPASSNSDSSTSEESSRCTAKYNPSSSIGDMASLAKDEEDSQKLYEPMSLRDLVLRLLMSLPFGEAMLKELAEVSRNLEQFANQLVFKGSMSGQRCPQRELARKIYEDEQRKIVELHKKFLTRRRYDELPRNQDDDRVRIIGVVKEEIHSPTKILPIIREETSENEFPYLEDRSDDRLKARNLGEWLTLARHKSKSTSNLDCTTIPINNLRRTVTATQNEQAKCSNGRRRSLPQEIYEQQLVDIMEKEREIQRELEKLEEEKRKLRAEIAPSKQKEFQMDDFLVSKKGDFAVRREDANGRKERPASMPVFPTEYFRQQMYEEYMDKFTERQERKQHKVIKISSKNDLDLQEKESALKSKELIHPIEIEQEFMDKVKKKLGRHLSLEEDAPKSPPLKDDTEENEPVIVLDGDKVKGVETLPKHLQEFLDDLATQHEDDSIWSPGQPRRPPTPPNKSYQRTESQGSHNDPISPVWTPKSASASPVVERKEFRPVNFQSPVLGRKVRARTEAVQTPDFGNTEPPWKLPEGGSDTALNLSSTLERRLPTSQSSPGFGNYSRLPRVQNPTVTLLQKAREGQLPRGAYYLDQDRKLPNDRPPIKYPGEVLYQIRNEYTSESESEKPRNMADVGPRKFKGVGPTTKDGMPLILRSEVKNEDQSKWYKRMYDTIHKQKPHRDEYVTVKYKQKRAQYPYTSGYLSEPEPGAYDSDFTEYKYQTLDRRRTPQTHLYLTDVSYTMPRNAPEKSYSSSDIVKNTHEKYNNQPGKIENYRPGHSSISEKEAKRWWDEVMDIFDGWLDENSTIPSYEVLLTRAMVKSVSCAEEACHLEQQNRVPPQKPRSFINQALKESGYESDSTLVFKRKEENAANQISPREQKEAYKTIQKGGDVPFQGLRKPAPERPKESPRKYVENEVTIHYKTPIRTEIKEYVSEDELAHRQAEAMKKIYEEERKRKYLQELQDMKSRRHTDNFIPSQKSPIPLNRYDDFDDLTTPTKPRVRSPEPRLVAKALYNFVGQSARELTFRKGDLIYVRRQVDKNWYEGELNAMVGLFPVNYVEIVPYEGIRITTPRKAHEGQGRAKYNFIAQTHLELSLAKGELVTITRRVDDNWFEGKIGGRKGIFPVSYVEVLIDPSDPAPPSTKPVASPAAHSLLLNGSSQGKDSMGSHLYTPNIPNPITSRDNGYHHAKPVQLSGTGTYSTLPKPSSNKSPLDQTLHIETQSEPIPYRALYKYTPQNDDELELLEGDTVYVLEKCDDGWYVGSSERTGAFGTFPGNYVEKI